MHPILAKAAFALPRVGAISEPVPFGKNYLLIRLDERRPAAPIPFDEVKDTILEKMRNDHIKDQRVSTLAAIPEDPTMKVNQPALDALVHRVDSRRLKPPAETLPPAPPPSQK